MTLEERKEAIEYLKKYRELDKQLYQAAPFTSVSHDALVKCLRHWGAAIQALEQETCEDAISRQAVNTLVDELERAISDERGCMSRGRSTSTIMRDILDLPSVKPEPKIGHCKDCKYFEYDCVAKVDGIPLIVEHEFCKRWGDECKTREDGYCFLFEPQERSEDDE